MESFVSADPLARPDEELAALNILGKESKRGVAMGFKKYQLPFLESQIHFLGLFDRPFQMVVMEARAQLASLHEDIDQARFYLRKPLISLFPHRITKK